MPDVLSVKTAVWHLTVWTKDAESPCSRLAAMLKTRGKELSPSRIRLSPPLEILDTHPLPVSALREQADELVLPKPVFFENRLYEFDFQFSGDMVDLQPRVVHWRKDIEDGFHQAGKNLRGGIHFGNDIGWFRLGLEFSLGGARTRQHLSFEVLPIKMDLDGDFGMICKDVDAEYPLWRLSFARKTELELASSRWPYERFPLLWLAMFRVLRQELEDAVRLICRSPHARLLPEGRFLCPDRLRGKLPSKQEERVTRDRMNGDLHRRYRVETRRLSVDTPENRFVKMVLTRCTRELSGLVRKARQSDRAPDQGRLSDAFFRELQSWLKPLKQRLSEPLFRETGDFAGLAHESLVLHYRAGYARVYRIWQELKLYLDLFGQRASVCLKSAAELYEVWCLLEIRRMLLSLGFVESMARRGSLKTSGLEKKLEDGMGTAFCFTRRDGLEVRLAHEPLFGFWNQTDTRGIFSWTTPQKPDILLEASFPGGRRIRWVFDAKYRLSPDETGEDRIPEDALNQMHRYRDALIHLEPADDGVAEKSRPVVGAFVLYPGFYDEILRPNPYEAGIEAVGIGGFPMLPGRENRWLRAFLKEKFSDLSDGYLTEHIPEFDEHLLHESVRIAPTGLRLARYGDLVLAASLGGTAGRDGAYVDRFLTGTASWYHIPVSTTDKKIARTVMRELRFCAVAVHRPDIHDRCIEYLYDVLSVRRVKRCELTVEQAGKVETSNRNDYWLLRLGNSRRLKELVSTGGTRHFRFRLTGAAEILAACRWDNLPDRYPRISCPAE
ncbi:MAG: restriction endonuclease-like protein [Acidobacteria bacterium]|nr:restriction endonuclease-like protein [Acidobacteriota bacterium]